MAPIALEAEDHSRDAAFNTAMHGKTVMGKGFGSMFKKDHAAHQAATEEYWKHWDNKEAATETDKIREVRTSLTFLISSLAKLFGLAGTASRVCFPDAPLL